MFQGTGLDVLDLSETKLKGMGKVMHREVNGRAKDGIIVLNL